MDWGKKWLVDFNAGKTQLVLFDRSNNNGSTDVKMDGSVLEEKLSFKMLGLTCSKLDWSSYIISIVKTASRKIGALIRPMKFLSPEVALYLYKSTIQPCTEYCCYLELLDKLQKQICRTAGPSLAASFKPLVHPLLKEGLFIDLIACMIFLLLFLHMLQGCLCLQFLSSHS